MVSKLFTTMLGNLLVLITRNLRLDHWMFTRAYISTNITEEMKLLSSAKY